MVIWCLGPRDSCREVFKILKILIVVALYILETVLHTEKSSLTRGIDLHTHNTRGAKNYTLPIHHLALYEKKPSYIGAKFTNILRAETFKHKRQQIITWLQDHAFYTVLGSSALL